MQRLEKCDNVVSENVKLCHSSSDPAQRKEDEKMRCRNQQNKIRAIVVLPYDGRASCGSRLLPRDGTQSSFAGAPLSPSCVLLWC